MSDLEKKLNESQEKETELTTELENMKKLVRMINSGSSKLDEVLAVERLDKEHFELGYTSLGKAIASQTVFVKESTSGVKKDEDLILKAPIVTPTRRLVATPGIAPSMTQGKIIENIWVPICHYYNKRGHIRPWS